MEKIVISPNRERQKPTYIVDAFNARLFDLETACLYTARGRTKAKAWLASIGAVRRFGNSVRYDRLVIDNFLDQLDDRTDGDAIVGTV